MKIRKKIISLLTICLLAGCGSGNGEEFASVDDTEEINYTILSKDVPNFDTSPIRYEDHGFIYLENGSYGFITADNENIVPSGRYITTRVLQGVCMYEKESTASEPNIYIDQLLGLTDENVCPYGIGGVSHIYVLGNDERVYSVLAGQVETVTPSGQSYIAPKSDPYATEYDWTNYYIVASDLKTVYGPYEASETASFSATQIYNLDSRNPYKGSLSAPNDLSNTNHSLFYEKTEKGYIIHSIDGLSSSKETYDFAQPISESAMKVEKDGKMGVVDTSLNEVYMGDFEDCSELINNRGYVKADGQWLYVEFENSSLEKAEADYTEGYITLSGKYATTAKGNHNYVLIELDSPVNLTVEGKKYENVDTIELAEEVINDSVNEGDSIIVYGKLETNEISEVNYADYYLNHAFICAKENYIPGIYSLSKECSIYDKPNGTQEDAKFSKGKKVIIIFIFLHKDGSAWGLTSDYTWICLKDKSGTSNAKCIQKMAADTAEIHTDYVPGTYSVKKEIQVYDGPSKTTRVRELKQGEEVIIIYVFIDEDGHIWGMIKDGEWIYMDSSVSLQGENTTASAADTNKEDEEEECPYAAGTYRLNYDMNVRTEPVYTGDNSNIRTVQSAGTNVTVSEIVKDSNGAYWGKIGDKQWICIWGSYNGDAKDYMTRL